MLNCIILYHPAFFGFAEAVAWSGAGVVLWV